MFFRKRDSKEVEKGREGAVWRTVLTAAGIAAGAVAAVYLAGAFFFAGHYYWGTQIDGKDYSFQSRERVREEILNPSVNYRLSILGREGMEDVLRPEELGMTYAFDDTLDRVNAGMTGLGWPVMLWKEHSYELPKTILYDQEALRKRLEGSPFWDDSAARKPVDARIGEYVEGEGYFIIEEDPGTVLDHSKVLDAVKKALDELAEELDLTEGNFYSQAGVRADDTELREALETANRYVSARILYTWNDATEVVDGGLIHEWVRIEGSRVSLDQEAVRDFINQMAREHDTFGKNRRFITTDGEELVLKGGSYGWWSDRAAEAEALAEAIRKGEQGEREPVFLSRGYARGSAGEDIGSSYVEIDLGEQHLYLYVDGEMILESDLVSGNLSRGYGTPAGVFGLTYKERNATLTGETYASHVDYWMPFNGNIGMHDASWRGGFGGDIYMNSGSHGCINLPPQAAAQIYEQVERGFPVICYY